jgi:hypothetical protein
VDNDSDEDLFDKITEDDDDSDDLPIMLESVGNAAPPSTSSILPFVVRQPVPTPEPSSDQGIRVHVYYLLFCTKLKSNG